MMMVCFWGEKCLCLGKLFGYFGFIKCEILKVRVLDRFFWGKGGVDSGVGVRVWIWVVLFFIKFIESIVWDVFCCYIVGLV